MNAPFAAERAMNGMARLVERGRRMQTGPACEADKELLEFYGRVADATGNAWRFVEDKTGSEFWLFKTDCEVAPPGERHGQLAIVPRWIARNARWVTNGEKDGGNRV